jgi:UDP-2,3-diacylglucosamine hydrolase
VITGSHLFIADLHLDPANRGRSALARRFLKQAHGSRHLYILGDMFEYWLGDDVGLLQYSTFINELQKLSRSGCGITVMLGNRDFLLGESFATRTGATLITADESVITIAGQRVLMMHGDTLCTDDVDYQRFRHSVRTQRWQQQFLAKSIDERRHEAEALRAASHDASFDKSPEVMDVNADMAMARLQATDCRILIHGHTHRPAIHTDEQSDCTRLVVGDWHASYAQFGQWDGTRFSLETFR